MRVRRLQSGNDCVQPDEREGRRDGVTNGKRSAPAMRDERLFFRNTLEPRELTRRGPTQLLRRIILREEKRRCTQSSTMEEEALPRRREFNGGKANRANNRRSLVGCLTMRS